jgi:hypothetical protein
MRRLSPADLLDLWERGRPRHPVDRALLMLGTAFPERSFDELADLPVGRRDAELLELRRELLGTRLEGVANCPSCGEKLEFSLDARALAGDVRSAAPTATVTVAGCRFRLPNSRDAARITGAADEQAAARLLLRFCRVPTETSDDPTLAERFTEAQLEEIEARMAEADPLADIRLLFSCEVCSHRWEQLFDIGEFLWEEIAARALRLLREVHVLARTYAWSEREILAMSDVRRETYLAMAEA